MANVTGSLPAAHVAKLSEQASFGNDFGALADTIWVPSVVTSGSATIQVAGVTLVPGDAGKYVRIPNAGAATGVTGAYGAGHYVHYSRIASVTDATHAVLVDNCTAGVTTSMHYGNDYSAQIQTALSASGVDCLKLASSPGRFIGAASTSYMKPGCHIFGGSRGNGKDCGNGFVSFNPAVPVLQFQSAMWGTVNVVAGSTTSAVTLATANRAGNDFSNIVISGASNVISIAGHIYPIIAKVDSTHITIGPEFDPVYGTTGPIAPNATGATFVLQLGPTNTVEIDGGFAFRDFSIIGAKGIQIQNAALENYQNYLVQSYVTSIDVSSLYIKGDYAFTAMPGSQTSTAPTLAGLTSGTGMGYGLNFNLSLRASIKHATIDSCAISIVLSAVSDSVVQDECSLTQAGNWVWCQSQGFEGNNPDIRQNQLIGIDRVGGINLTNGSNAIIYKNSFEQIPQLDYASTCYVRMRNSFGFRMIGNNFAASFSSTAPLYDIAPTGPYYIEGNVINSYVTPLSAIISLSYWNPFTDCYGQANENSPNFPLPDVPYLVRGVPNPHLLHYRNPGAFGSMFFAGLAGGTCPFTESPITGRFTLDRSIYPLTWYSELSPSAARSWNISVEVINVTLPADSDHTPFVAVDLAVLVGVITGLTNNGDGTTTIALDRAHGMSTVGNAIGGKGIYLAFPAGVSFLDGDLPTLSYPSSTSIRVTGTDSAAWGGSGRLYRYCRVLGGFTNIYDTAASGSATLSFQIAMTGVDANTAADSFTLNLTEDSFFRVNVAGSYAASIDVERVELWEERGNIPSPGAVGNFLISAGSSYRSGVPVDLSLTGSMHLGSGSPVIEINRNGASVIVDATKHSWSWAYNQSGNNVSLVHFDGSGSFLGNPFSVDSSGNVTLTGFAPNVGAATGVLPVANGGTGLTSPGASGNVLKSNGTAWISAAGPTGGAASGANSDITSLSGLTTPLSRAQGGAGITAAGFTGSVTIPKLTTGGLNGVMTFSAGICTAVTPPT